jgi:hypothetical protein
MRRLDRNRSESATSRRVRLAIVTLLQAFVQVRTELRCRLPGNFQANEKNDLGS